MSCGSETCDRGDPDAGIHDRKPHAHTGRGIDVSNAIYEGTDAIMLSAESAAGQFPIEAVQTMNNVAVEVEADPTYRTIIDASRAVERASIADGIVAAAREIAETTNIAAIGRFTSSGTTVILTARERLACQLLR